MHDVLQAIRDGKTVIYPTETLYALGCDAYSPEAVAEVARIKGRDKIKPLPLIIGSLEGLRKVTDEVPDKIMNLAKRFWPGSLSILVRANDQLAPLVSDEEGFTSVRWSPHPFASELSRRLKGPVVATSANLAGKPPVGLPEDLDPELLAQVGAAYLDPPWPAGGAPSTVVKVFSNTQLAVCREGAVSIKQLCDMGYGVTREYA